jgi:hypothetical protein
LWIPDNPETFKLSDGQVGFLHTDTRQHIDPTKARRRAPDATLS